jgi:hypothetical protein
MVVGMNTKTNDLMVIGPDDFNAIQMLGMLEFAKSRVEMRDDPPKRFA